MVGNRKFLSVWMDSWVYDNGMRAPFSKNAIINYEMKVEMLIDSAQGVGIKTS